MIGTSPMQERHRLLPLLLLWELDLGAQVADSWDRSSDGPNVGQVTPAGPISSGRQQGLELKLGP